MARTAGALSLVNISWAELKDLLGDTYNGKISVSLKWLKNHTQGIEEFSLVRKDEVGNAVRGIEVEQSVQAPVVRRAAFTVIGD